MAQATDSPRGKVFFFEDFTGMDVIADKPEYGVDTDPATQVLATAQDGVVRITMDAGQTNVGGVLFGTTQWDVTDGLVMEARIRLSAIGTAEERVGFWLTDLQEATLSEYPFTIATVTAAAVADPENAIGVFWEGSATTNSWYALSQNTDTLAMNGVVNQTKFKGPVAATWNTLKLEIAPGATHVEFSVDGEHLYTYDGTAAIADVPLIPVFGCTEGATAINADIDYIYIEKPRTA